MYVIKFTRVLPSPVRYGSRFQETATAFLKQLDGGERYEETMVDLTYQWFPRAIETEKYIQASATSYTTELSSSLPYLTTRL